MHSRHVLLAAGLLSFYGFGCGQDATCEEERTCGPVRDGSASPDGRSEAGGSDAGAVKEAATDAGAHESIRLDADVDSGSDAGQSADTGTDAGVNVPADRDGGTEAANAVALDAGNGSSSLVSSYRNFHDSGLDAYSLGVRCARNAP